jgi:hypothetical protein
VIIDGLPGNGTEGYDVIGDVLGCADKLRDLLLHLGYRLQGGAYRHPVRQAVFVGDLIDRGPQQLETLELVRAMTDGGNAQIVMGNHEFNALCYATEHDGAYLRPHTPKNDRQHEAFRALRKADRWRFLDWFMSFPLWIDLDGLRVVHACWHEESIEVARTALAGNRFNTIDQLVEASTNGTELFDAIEVLLKGPEIDLLRRFGLPSFRDKDGHLRQGARVKWWNSTAKNLRDATVLPPAATTEDDRPYHLPIDPVDPSDLYLYRDAIPVVYGHYWREGKPREKEDWTSHTACVDFSAVKGGTLIAYRWSGEAVINLRNYYPHGLDIVSS